MLSHAAYKLKPKILLRLLLKSKQFVQSFKIFETTSIPNTHTQWFRCVEKMCQAVNTQPKLPRITGCQQHRSNHPASSPSEYYRLSISIPLLDHLLLEIDTRFSKHQQTAIQGLSLVPSILVKSTTEEIAVKLTELVNMYSEDLPHPASVESESQCWQMKWKQELDTHGQACLPTTASQAMRHATSLFPNIRVLLAILCTLPVTSCSSERSFSGLKRIKMVHERLTGLSLVHLHRDIPISIPDAIDEFARRHPRRMELLNIFVDSS